MSALQNGSQYATTPEGVFFIGHLAAVPNASLVGDTCTDGAFSGGGNDLSGVTFLDAGDQVGLQIGSQQSALDRAVDGQGQISYSPSAGPIAYTPGDSIVVTVPGAIGGFGASTIRAKTAEAFTMDPVTMPSNNDAIQLRWTPSVDLHSAFIVELRYDPAGGATPTRELLCTYNDDGIDSIPYFEYQPWVSPTASAQEVVATRLRTAYGPAPNSALLGVVSLFQVPTPASP